MTKKVFIGTLVTFALVSSLMAAEKYICSWNTVKMAVDGVDLDWQGETPNLYNKTQVDYAFKNDANYLYVLFKFKDPKQFMSTIAFTGLNVYLDANGKKKKDYTINFRKKQLSAEEFIVKMEAEQGQLSQADKDKIRANKFYLDHDIVVTNKKAKSQSLEGAEGLVPAIFRANQTQDGAYLWEIAIPLARGADLAPGIGAAPGQMIKVGFEWGGSTPEWKEAQASRMG